MANYLLEIKKIVDALVLVGAQIDELAHVEVILKGFSKEYSSFITSINTRNTPLQIRALEAMLMAQEEWLEKFKKPEPMMANVIVSFVLTT